MMRFLTLYTADKLTQPTPEHMQEMGAYMERETKAGKLIAAGGLKQRAANGLKVRQRAGAVSVEAGGAEWAGATGWAILQAETREDLIKDVKEFLALAGDGVSEIIEISGGPEG